MYKEEGFDFGVWKLLFFFLLLYPLSATAVFCTRQKTEKNAGWSRAECQTRATCQGAGGEWSTSLAAQNIRGAACRGEMSLYWSITSGLFCFLLIPHYSLVQARAWGALGTTEQTKAADANEGGREKRTFKWQKNLAQGHILLLYSQGKLKYGCCQCQLLTLTTQLQDIVLEFMLIFNFRFHLFFFFLCLSSWNVSPLMPGHSGKTCPCSQHEQGMQR